MSKAKHTKKNKKTATNALIVFLVIIMLVCAVGIYKILKAYYDDQKVYKNIRETSQADGFTGDIDFDALREINPDVVAWIYIKDTNINYPIVKTDDNDKYLHTLFNGDYGGAGTIFCDCGTEDPFHQFCTITYGHHMKDLTMYNNLKYFKDADFFASHPRGELILPEGKYHLEFIAFLNVPAADKAYEFGMLTDEEKEEYVNYITHKAIHKNDIPVDVTADRLVGLSTCAYEFEGARYFLIGKMTPWE